MHSSRLHLRLCLRRTTHLGVLVCLASALIAAINSVPSVQAATSCTRYASTSGSDSSPGTSSAPFGTVQTLVSSLDAGQTGCLIGGTYNGNVSFSSGGRSERARLTLKTAPGSSQATVHGIIEIKPSADYVTLDNLHVDAANASQVTAVQLLGDHERLTNSNITGANQDRIGVQIGFQRQTKGVEIVHNRIHNFGIPTTQLDHGIYVDLASEAVIRDNYIYDNAGGYGIQLWEHAQNSKIYNNTIDGNGAGSIIIAGTTNSTGGPSSHNEIYRNILSNPVSGNNTVIFWSNYSGGAPPGTGNTVNDNVYWNGKLDPGSAYGSKAGVSYSDDVSVDPQYVNRGGNDFSLKRRSPATGYGAREPVGLRRTSRG
jgi:Right handed beta helix region